MSKKNSFIVLAEKVACRVFSSGLNELISDSIITHIARRVEVN